MSAALQSSQPDDLGSRYAKAIGRGTDPSNLGNGYGNGSNGGAKQETVRKTGPDLSRNDPCWCGSGKKYKQCHQAEDDQLFGVVPAVHA